ncbi:ATP-binding cassette sub-family C member 4-like isoform X1 [Schistocerca americana]|uniref:ATP-binding cassette sub-family C member 4-like isoform X1 n=1 Tax=Schistocerca americana TaxID=7009 RepID=UPI001F501F43|nr:ATP-binding cassette sub-family C member 4-like isoform X1 [Schistocerca americana]
MDGSISKGRPRVPNPMVTAGPLSILTFWWLKDLFVLGSKKDLETDDLYDTLEGDLSEKLGTRLENNWNKEIAKAKKDATYKPSLLKALIKTFGQQYGLLGIFVAVNIVIVNTSRPILLGLLLQYFTPDTTVTEEAALWYGGGLIVILFLCLFMSHHSGFIAQQIGMRIRVAICSLIYRKTIRLSKATAGQTATGKMINLLSNDVNRFDFVTFFLHYFWITPLETVVATYFIWKAVGWAAIIGVAGIFLQTMPVQTYITRMTTMYRSKIAVRTDDRVRLMNEIITGVQVIKMYAWEKPFEKMVEIARRNEVKVLRGANYLRGYSMAFMVFTERTSLYITVVAYALLGNVITADIVFTLAQFFNLLQLCLALCLPLAMQMSAEAKVSIFRIQEFLLQEEHVPVLPAPVTLRESDKEKLKETKTGVQMKKCSAKWSPSSITETLTNISMEVLPGNLCAVIGPVGAGKSSLLHVLLRELPLTSGSITTDRKISYASQDAWLFVGTVRQNILFGQPYDHRKYKEVVKACALKRDFELFPNGDKTLVGERGVSLSGGQRARINLARAVYRDADIYLLDDPLSAVDAHVGKHLFQECINGYLCRKTRILVTHQLQYLKDADLIVILNNGRIEDQGTFSELMTQKTDFINLLVSNQEESEKTVAPSMKKQLSVGSTYSSVPDEDEEDDFDEPDETAEMIERGKLKGTLYKDYATAGSSYWLLAWLALFCLLAQLSSTGADYWVSFWTNQEEARVKLLEANISASFSHVQNITDYVSTEDTFTGLFSAFLDPNNTESVTAQWKNDTARNVSFETYSEENLNVIGTNFNAASGEHLLTRDQHIIIYTVFVLGCLVITTYRAMLFFKVCMNSSQGLHNRMFNSVLKGSMRFFDSNPSGRVLNRFSKDMGAVDELLPKALLDSMQISLTVIGVICMVVFVNYYFTIVIIIIGPLFYKIRQIYLRTAQDIKRLEGNTRSPVFSYISASLNGLTTIRSSEADQIVVKEFDYLQDRHSSAWHTSIACNTAFGICLDLISTSFASFVIVVFLTIETGIPAGFVGLAISQSLMITGLLQYGIRQTTEVVNQMTAVERILQYNNIEMEGPFESEPGTKPPPGWPKQGAIRFEKLSLQYIPTDPPVLRGLDFSIEPGHKVGIVGRTGAGKSSLIAALFRLAKLEGAIYIDDVNTQSMGLHDLRKRISIIPQEPVLFSATLRYNLDPFEEFKDHQLWSALEEVELKDAFDSLEFRVYEGGSNLSVGQRQLICLARAILRNNRVLVLDEATANVDPQTDGLIQTTIRTKFKACTVITIAHRLNTIMDSDKVLVMDSGTMVEYAHPHVLLQFPEGYFYKMVEQTGESMAAQLAKVAEEAYNRKP